MNNENHDDEALRPESHEERLRKAFFGFMPSDLGFPSPVRNASIDERPDLTEEHEELFDEADEPSNSSQ